ncbi:S-layer homology domain-containing protein [Rossellomorea sp. NPDC077527]|uniref:S-layer homology domain-containing protein n=1 Tax=Rossellomorea sp. NPDC077527 TaxID=3364510 RepID=UPI0037CB2EDA
MAYQSKSNRKFLATSLTAAMVASAVAPAASAASTFPDVKEGSFYFEYVSALAEAGIIDGRPDGSFDLGGKLNRAEAAKMIAKIIKLDTTDAPASSFEDVKEDVWYTDYINALYAEGLIDGVSETMFAPNKELTRAQLAKLVVDAYGLELDASAEHPFTDVKEDVWYTDYIKTLYKHELIDGKTATTFAPNEPIKRADFAKLLTEADWAVGDTLDKPMVEVVGVNAVNATTVVMSFNSAIGSVSHENFSIDGGLNVSKATLSADGKSVTLTLDGNLVDGNTYKVTAKDIKGAKGEVAEVLEGSFKWELTNADAISLSKSTFHPGESLVNYLEVRDENGNVVSNENFKAVTFTSDNTTVVNSSGVAQDKNGTANVTIKVEYKDGTFSTQTVAVKVEKVVIADNKGFTFVEKADYSDAPENTVEFNMLAAAGDADTSVFVGDSEYIAMYNNTSDSNPMDKHLSPSEYEFTSSSPLVAQVGQNTGAVTGIAAGKATITAKHLTTGKTYKAEIEVKDAPKLNGLSVSANQLTLSDEAVDGTGTVVTGVNQKMVELEGLDQYGEEFTANFGTKSTDDTDKQVFTDVFKSGDVLTVATDSKDFKIAVDNKGVLTVTALGTDKAVNGAAIKVSYKASASDASAKYSSTINVNVVNVSAAATLAEAVKNASSIEVVSSATSTNAKYEGTVYDDVDFMAFVKDSNGNRVADATSLLTVDVAAADQAKYILDDSITHKVQFATTARKLMTDSGSASVNWEVKSGTSVFTGAQTLSVSNTYPAPHEVTVSNQNVFVKATDAVSINDILFGKVSKNEMLLDSDDGNYAYAIKAGNDGYVSGLAPMVSAKDNTGKSVALGANVYGLTFDGSDMADASAFAVDSGYDLEAETVVTNTTGTAKYDGSKFTGNGTLTLIVNEVYVKGDTRTDKNLLASPVTISVTVK